MATERPRIRYAVVGLGNIAQAAVLPAFEHARENTELTALVSSETMKLRALGKRFNVEHCVSYDEFDKLAAEGVIDAVYIALPNHLHREWTERAARAGLHVLCEKPMALSVADCEAMIQVTNEHKVRLMIGYRLHFEKGNLHAMQALREGRIGRARFITAAFSHLVRPGDIRTRSETGGGALYDLGVYCINATRYLFEAEPILAFGTTSGTDVDDLTTVTLGFPDDRFAQFTVSQGAASESYYRVCGTEGDLLLDPAFEYSEALRLALTVKGRTRRRRFPRRDQFAPELIYFSRCIQNEEAPRPSGEEGMADVRVIEAVLQSAREHRPIPLPPREPPPRPLLTQEMHKPPVHEQVPIGAPPPSLH